MLTLNYSKMHITVNANKNTKLTPTALNIVYSPPRIASYSFLGFCCAKVSFLLRLILYHFFVFCIQYSAKFFRNFCNAPWFKKDKCALLRFLEADYVAFLICWSFHRDFSCEPRECNLTEMTVNYVRVLSKFRF